MKENNLCQKLFLIQTKYLFEIHNIYFIQRKYLWAKYIFDLNQFFFNPLKHGGNSRYHLNFFLFLLFEYFLMYSDLVFCYFQILK